MPNQFNGDPIEYEDFLALHWHPYIPGPPTVGQELLIRDVLKVVNSVQYFQGKGGGETTVRAALARMFLADEGIQWLPLRDVLGDDLLADRGGYGN